jgi:UDP-glucuronate decarboxylase
MATVLITGGAGFLGSHFAEKLLNDDHRVIIIDNLVTGNLDNISHLNDSNIEFINHDVTKELTKVKCDYVLNLACPASPPAYQKDPVFTLKTAMLGTYNMLELARENNAVFFQASTSEIYGDPDVHPQVESYWGNVNPIGIRSCYDEGKRIGETLCFDYFRKYNLQIKVVRIFNTYGPRMDPNDGRVVSNLICQALRGEDITIYGKGDQTRSFCYVDDLIEGMRRLLFSHDFQGPVNIGNPDEFTINELANLVLSKVPGNSKLSYHPLPGDDPKQRKPDISLANDVLGWSPKINLNEGLDKTIMFFKTQLNVS